jgi:hypothetical protein
LQHFRNSTDLALRIINVLGNAVYCLSSDRLPKQSPQKNIAFSHHVLLEVIVEIETKERMLIRADQSRLRPPSFGPKSKTIFPNNQWGKCCSFWAGTNTFSQKKRLSTLPEPPKR